jgi:hypothetical protein
MRSRGDDEHDERISFSTSRAAQRHAGPRIYRRFRFFGSLFLLRGVGYNEYRLEDDCPAFSRLPLEKVIQDCRIHRPQLARRGGDDHMGSTHTEGTREDVRVYRIP